MENRNAKKEYFHRNDISKTVIRKERETCKGVFRVGRLGQRGPGEVERSVKMEELLI